MHERSYESAPASSEGKFVLAVAKQISEVYRYKNNLPPELKLESTEEEFRQSLEKHLSSPELKFIHTLHRMLVVGTGNNRYLGDNKVSGLEGTDWAALAKQLHTYVTSNMSELNQNQAQNQGFFLTADVVKLSGDAVKNAVTKIDTADQKYSKALSVEETVKPISPSNS